MREESSSGGVRRAGEKQNSAAAALRDGNKGSDCDASSRPIVAPGKRKQADRRASDQAKERRKREEPFVLQNPERDGRRL